MTRPATSTPETGPHGAGMPEIGDRGVTLFPASAQDRRPLQRPLFSSAICACGRPRLTCPIAWQSYAGVSCSGKSCPGKSCCRSCRLASDRFRRSPPRPAVSRFRRTDRFARSATWWWRTSSSTARKMPTSADLCMPVVEQLAENEAALSARERRLDLGHVDVDRRVVVDDVRRLRGLVVAHDPAEGADQVPQFDLADRLVGQVAVARRQIVARAAESAPASRGCARRACWPRL